jgi:hypothetical protein
MWPKPKDSSVFRLPCLRVNRADVSGLHMSQTSHGSSHKAGQDRVHLICYGVYSTAVVRVMWIMAAFAASDVQVSTTPERLRRSALFRVPISVR